MTTPAANPNTCGATCSAKPAPERSPFQAWWSEMLDIHADIDSRWTARDVADIAFAAGYNFAKSQNNQ